MRKLANTFLNVDSKISAGMILGMGMKVDGIFSRSAGMRIKAALSSRVKTG